MSSNRSLLLEFYKKMFESIKEANGFENDVKQVERKMLFYDTVASFPVLMVLGGGEKFEDTLGGRVISTLQIKIRGYSKDEEDPQGAIDSLIEDVLNILDDPTYNTYHSKCKLASLDTDEGWMAPDTNGVGMMEVTVEQMYTFERGTP